MPAPSPSTRSPAIFSGTTSPEYGDGFNAMLCCGPIHRGVALAGRSRHRRAPRRAAGRAKPRRRKDRLGRSDRRLEARRDDEFRAARREGSRHHRRFGRRIWRSRLSEVVQREDRRAGMANLHRSGARRARQRDLAEGRQLEDGRRPDLAHRELRRRHRHALLGRRQSRLMAVGPASGRQLVDRLDAGARPEHRQDQVGLSVHAE